MHRLRRCGAAIGAVRFAGRSAVVAGARSAAAAPAASPERPARTAGRMLAGLLVVGLLVPCRTYLGDRLLRIGRVVVSLRPDTDSAYDADVVARAVVRNARAQAP